MSGGIKLINTFSGISLILKHKSSPINNLINWDFFGGFLEKIRKTLFKSFESNYQQLRWFIDEVFFVAIFTLSLAFFTLKTVFLLRINTEIKKIFKKIPHWSEVFSLVVEIHQTIFILLVIPGVYYILMIRNFFIKNL